MTPTTRKRILFSVGVALIVLGVAVAIVVRDVRRAGQAVSGLLTTALLGAAAQAQEDAELPRVCDVVVDRELDGSLRVWGKALPEPVRLSSNSELRGFLRSLPGRGTAMARVKESPVKPGHVWLGAPRSAAGRAALVELTTLLVDEGFTIPRVPGPKLLPLRPRDPAPPIRPGA
jgi:hypothetical protein